MRWQLKQWVGFVAMAAVAVTGVVGYSDPHHTLTLFAMLAIILLLDIHAAMEEATSE